METGRELFEGLLKGRPTPRPPYVPLVTRLASRVGGVSFEAMTSDPTLWSTNAARMGDLFDFDGVAVGLDPTVLAEACGCPIRWEDDRPVLGSFGGALAEAPEGRGRLACALEAARRAFPLLRTRRACVAGLAGPATLAEQLFGPEASTRLGEAKQLAVRVAEAFCKTGPDALCLLESVEIVKDGAAPPALRRAYGTIRNVTSYYNVPLVLCAEVCAPADLPALGQLPADLWVAGLEAVGAGSALAALGKGGLGVGVGLPLEDPDRARSLLGEWLGLSRAGTAGRHFFTSLEPRGEVPDLEQVRRLVGEIRATRL